MHFPRIRLTRDMSAFIMLLLAMMLMSLGMGGIMPLMAVHARALGASGIWIGLIVGASPLVRGIFQIFFGRLADLYRIRMLVLLGLGGYSLAALGLFTATTPSALLGWRIAQGMMLAVVQPAAWAYAGLVTPTGREGTLMSVFNVSFISGFVLGPITGSLLYARFGMGIPFLAMSGLGAMAFLLVIFFVPERTAKTSSASPPLAPFSVIMRDGVVQGVIAGRFSLSTGWAVFEAMLPLWVAVHLGLPPYIVGLIMSAQAICESSIQLLCGVLADRVDRRRLGLIGFCCAVLAIYLMPFAVTPSQLLAAALLLASSTGVYVPAITALSVERGRLYGMGSIMGTTSTAMSLGLGFGSLMGGAVMDLFNIQTSFWVAAVVATCGVFVFALRTKAAARTVLSTNAAAPPGLGTGA